MELKEIITEIDNLTNLNASIYFQNHLEQSDYTEIKNNDKQYRTLHGLNGMLKSSGLHLHELYPSQIDKSSSMFRSDKDFN